MKINSGVHAWFIRYSDKSKVIVKPSFILLLPWFIFKLKRGIRMKHLLNCTMIGISIFLVLIMMVSLAHSSEREHHEHEKHYRSSYPVVEHVTEKVEIVMPEIQHQFNPDSKKTQFSIGAATADFKGNTALGISMGKRICNEECKSAFWHGNVKSNGEQTSAGIGVTFSWD